MKKQFEEPVLEVILFSVEDIMTTSAALQGEDWGDVDWLPKLK